MTDQTREEKYFSFVRHEIGNHIAVIRESFNLALDKKAVKDPETMEKVLAIGLEKADKLTKLIQELVSEEAFKDKLKEE